MTLLYNADSPSAPPFSEPQPVVCSNWQMYQISDLTFPGFKFCSKMLLRRMRPRAFAPDLAGGACSILQSMLPSWITERHGKEGETIWKMIEESGRERKKQKGRDEKKVCYCLPPLSINFLSLSLIAISAATVYGITRLHVTSLGICRLFSGWDSLSSSKETLGERPVKNVNKQQWWYVVNVWFAVGVNVVRCGATNHRQTLRMKWTSLKAFETFMNSTSEELCP